MQYLVNFIDTYVLEILITSGVVVALLFLGRSFKRSLLIAKGQARFVLEEYDVATEKIHKWITFVILFMLLPLVTYVKFLDH